MISFLDDHVPVRARLTLPAGLKFAGFISARVVLDLRF